MFEYSQNPAVYTFLEFEPHRSIEETEEYLRKLIARSKLESGHYWFIALKESKKVIGTVGLLNIDKRKGSAEIGYGLSPDYWGQGYFQEALVIVAKYLFLELGFHRISAITQSDNEPSVRALERLGFKREGLMRDFYLHTDGRRYDAALMGILRHEVEDALKQDPQPVSHV